MEETPSAGPPPDPESWLERHGDALYAFALSRVRRHEVAEDVVQEALLAALNSRESFRSEAAERTWLIGILKHKIFDHFRRQGRESALAGSEESLVDGLFEASGRWKRPPGAWGLDPADLAERREFWEAFDHCLDGLPPRSRLAFAAHVIDETDSGKICQELRISATNLWVILHRARVLLRACLERSWFQKPAEGGGAC